MSRVTALRKNSLVELVFIVAIAIFLALAVQAYAIKPYRIPSGSMEPTLDVGERVLVQRVTTRLGVDPKVGNIIVFHPPAGADGVPPQCGAPSTDGQPCAKPTTSRSDQTFIKRVVADRRRHGLGARRARRGQRQGAAGALRGALRRG